MSESWITLTDADVFAADAKERQSIVAVKRQDDLPDIVAGVTEQVREAYRSGGRAIDDSEGTIPASLKERAIAIALWKFITTGVPENKSVQTATREAAFKEAQEFLTKVSARDIKGVGGAQIVSSKTRQATRGTLGGL